MQIRYHQHSPTPPPASPGRHGLPVLELSARLRGSINIPRYAYFSTVWNHKTKITSIGRYLLNTDSTNLVLSACNPVKMSWVTDAASFATEPGSPEHSCHSLCDRERAVHDHSWQLPCPHQTFHQLFFLRTCFISLENFLQNYYILFYIHHLLYYIHYIQYISIIYSIYIIY